MQRGGRGYAEETYPSRFLDDIPAELLSGRTRTGRTLRRGVPDEIRWSQPTRPESAPILEVKFRAGIRVRHAVWGEGIILNSRVQDGDEIVDIVFESVGIKRVAASLANLTII